MFPYGPDNKFGSEPNSKKIIEEITQQVERLINHEISDTRLTELYNSTIISKIHKKLHPESIQLLEQLVRSNNKYHIRILLEKNAIGNLVPDDYSTLQRIIELNDALVHQLLIEQFSMLKKQFERLLALIAQSGSTTFLNTNRETLATIAAALEAGFKHFERDKKLKANKGTGVFNTEEVIAIKHMVIEKLLNLLQLGWFTLS